MSAPANGNGKFPETLFAALAAFQADLPGIGKGNTASVRSDKGNYSYKYADLADVSAAVLPRLGALGLAFTARPTLLDGQFVLSYSLVHVSGDREDGIYMLPSSGTPQQIGSAITYARRYCLCAAVGVAPAEDDDDAAAAQTVTRQSAADAWENSTPAPPRQSGRPQPPPPSPEATDPEAQVFADEAHKATVPAEIESIHKRAREAQKVTALIRNPSSGGIGKLAVYLDWKRKQLMASAPPLAAALDADDPWTSAIEGMASAEDGEALLADVTDQRGRGEIEAERAALIETAIETAMAKRFPAEGKEAA